MTALILGVPMSRYNFTALRGAVDQSYDDCVNGRGPMWAYRNACLALDRALAQRDEDRRNSATLAALRFINFAMVAPVRSAQRAAQAAVGDALTLIRQRLTHARNTVADAQRHGDDVWYSFKRRHPILATAAPSLLAVAPQLGPLVDWSCRRWHGCDLRRWWLFGGFVGPVS